MENILLKTIENLTLKEILSPSGFANTGMVKLEDAIIALQELEVAVRNECECDSLLEEINRY